MVERLRQAERALHRDAPEGRLVAADAARGGRRADGAAGVGGETERDEAGRERRRVAARRSRGRVAGAGRVQALAEGRVGRGDAARELVQVRLAEDHRAGVDDALDGRRRALRHALAEDRRSEGRAEAGRVPAVLRRERHAGEQPGRCGAPVDRPGAFERPLRIDRDEGVQLRPRPDPVEVMGRHLLDRDLAGPDGVRDGPRRGLVERTRESARHGDDSSQLAVKWFDQYDRAGARAPGEDPGGVPAGRGPAPPLLARAGGVRAPRRRRPSSSSTPTCRTRPNGRPASGASWLRRSPPTT